MLKVTELCGECNNEVEIATDVESICPICSAPIVPCSMCDLDESNCATDCPFMKKY